MCKLMRGVCDALMDTFLIKSKKNVCLRSEEKDDTLSAISGGSLKPEIGSGQPATSHANLATPTPTASSITGNSVPTATPEVDEDEYSIKPPMDSWDKNGSPQKSKLNDKLMFDCIIEKCHTFRQFLFEL